MTLLLLAGTGEARQIARHCAEQGIDAIATLAGATRDPKPLAIKSISGGFGGADGFRQFLAQHKITRILDMTHPYAAQISARSFEIARDFGVPYLQFLRDPWVAGAGDIWSEIADETAAAPFVSEGATVFLATGRQTLHLFNALSHAKLICRQIDPPNGPFPFPNGRFEIGRPPFSVQDEVALFRELGVDVLIVKNAGGDASRSKLDAARQLKIPVLMIARPAPSGAPTVNSLDAVKAWI